MSAFRRATVANAAAVAWACAVLPGTQVLLGLLVAQGGGAPAAGLNVVHDDAAAAASPPLAAGAGHAAAAPVPPAGPGPPPGGGQPPMGAAAAAQAALPAGIQPAAAAVQLPGADDGQNGLHPPPPFWPEPQARWLSQSLTVRLLQRWTTAELENFLLSMWEEMLQVLPGPLKTTSQRVAVSVVAGRLYTGLRCGVAAVTPGCCSEWGQAFVRQSALR